MCCGKMIGSYDDLCQHLQSRHDELKRAIDCFVDMIAYYHSNDGDSKCRWCTLSLQEPQVDYADHLAECSVLRHFATFLAQPLLKHGDRGARSTDGSVRSHAAKHGTKSTKRPEASKTQQPIGEFFKRQQRRRLTVETAGGADGSSNDQTREGHPGCDESMQLHSVLGDIPGRHSPTVDEEVCGMEAGKNFGQCGTSSQSGFDAGTSQHSVGKGTQDQRLHQAGSPVASLDEKQSDSAGRILALPGLELQKQIPRDSSQEKGYTNGSDDDRLAGAEYSHGAGQSDRQVR